MNADAGSGPEAMPNETSHDSSNFALKQIRALLEPNALGPDRKLPTERALCEMLEVNRRAVRRALEVLEAEGRIWRRQGSGTFVGPAPAPSLESLEDLARQSDYMEVMEVRLRIEPRLASLAAKRATAEDVTRLAAIVERITEARDADERELWDSSLHRTVAEVAGNRLYLAIFDLIDRVRQDAAWIALRERARDRASLETYRAQHLNLIEAIGKGDADGASDAMHLHLLALRENLARQATAEMGGAA